MSDRLPVAWTRRAVVGLLFAAGAACLLPTLVMFAGLVGRPDAFEVFADAARTGRLIDRTLRATLGTLAFAMGLGAPMGLLLFRTDLPLRRTMVFGLILVACLPLYVVLTCWMALGGLPLWTGSVLGAAWITGVALAPIVALITGVGFASADRSIEDQALLDTTAWGVLRHVVLPQSRWALAAAAGVVVVLAVSTATVTDILNVRALADEVLVQCHLSGEPWRATALALPVFAAVLALAAFLGRGLPRFGAADPDDLAHGPRPLHLGRLRVPCAVLLLILAAGYLVPLGALVGATGGWGSLGRAARACRRELWSTLTLTPVAATLCVAMAIGPAWILVRAKRWRWVAGALLILLVATPAPIVGLGITRVLNRGPVLGAVYDSSAVLVIAYVIGGLPFAVLALLPAIRRVPRDLEEAASLDGCDWSQRLWRVVLPACSRGLAVSWFLVLVLALGEVGASVLVAPPGRSTLTIHFYTQIHAGVYPDTAATCLILLLIVTPPAMVLTWLLAPLLHGRASG